MIGSNDTLLSKFYGGVFGLKASGRTSPISATVYGDGYVGGLHFGMGVVPLGGSRESDVRRTLFETSATGKFQMADPDGIWIDINITDE